MTEATMAGLRERLDHLERQHRTLKRAASCAALVIAGVLLMGQATPAPRVIEAEKFVVRDPDGQSGKPGAAMEVSAEEIPALLLSDGQGKVLWRAP